MGEKGKELKSKFAENQQIIFFNQTADHLIIRSPPLKTKKELVVFVNERSLILRILKTYAEEDARYEPR